MEHHSHNSNNMQKTGKEFNVPIHEMINHVFDKINAVGNCEELKSPIYYVLENGRIVEIPEHIKRQAIFAWKTHNNKNNKKKLEITFDSLTELREDIDELATGIDLSNASGSPDTNIRIYGSKNVNEKENKPLDNNFVSFIILSICGTILCYIWMNLRGNN